MGRRLSFFTICCGLASAIGGGAAAQTAPVQSVTERELLQQQDLGIRFGSFLALPKLDVQIDHTDNVYASNQSPQADTFVSARAELAVRSQFAHHALDAIVYYDRTAYFRLTGENTSQYGALLDGRYDVGARATVTADGGYDRVAEPRTSLYSVTTASRPVLYDLYHGDLVAADTFGRLNVQLGGHVRRYDYHPAIFGTVSVDQSYRNLTAANATLDLGYDLTAATAVVLHGTLDHRRYERGYGDPSFNPATSNDGSADGTRIEAGVQHQVTSLIQAQVRAGWLHYSYADPRLNPLSALSYHGEVIWNVTPLTTVQATAERTVDEAISVIYAGNLRDEFHLNVQHELIRKLILQADARYAGIRPTAINTTLAAGQQLTSYRELDFDFGGHYYVGRHIRVNGVYSHFQRRSDTSFLAFSENVGMFGVTFSR